MANVPEDLTWQHGLEYKFSLPIGLKAFGINGTNTIYGFNGTNEFSCKPRDENIIKCKLNHEKVMIYELNPDNGNITTKETSTNNFFSKSDLLFDIGFDTKGVNQVTVNKQLSESKLFPLTKVIANLFNVGIDLKTFDGKSVELNEMNNYLLGSCIANIKVNYKENEKTEKGNWNLDLSPPMQKLSGRKLDLSKSWNTADCKSSNKFYWVDMLASFDEEYVEDIVSKLI